MQGPRNCPTKIGSVQLCVWYNMICNQPAAQEKETTQSPFGYFSFTSVYCSTNRALEEHTTPSPATTVAPAPAVCALAAVASAVKLSLGPASVLLRMLSVGVKAFSGSATMMIKIITILEKAVLTLGLRPTLL